MRAIEILIPGMLTTVQDKGRFGFQDTGVSPSGAMDGDSLELANILVGNDCNEACLECAFSGPDIRFTGQAVFALTGAPSNPILNGRPVPMYESVPASAGDVLGIGTVERGVRTYLAVSGGFDIPVVMHSRSTSVRGGFGGFQGRVLRRGDLIPLRLEPAAHSFTRCVLPEEFRPAYPETTTLRVLESRDSDRFERDSLALFLSSAWKVSASSDRMGIRLEGPVLRHSGSADIISSGVQTGTIQVPGQGNPIILAADRQTTGGYPVIAHVCSTDLCLLGRLAPGNAVVFAAITLEQAQEAIAVREESFRAIEEMMRGTRSRPAACGVSSPGHERMFAVEVNGRSYLVGVTDLS